MHSPEPISKIMTLIHYNTLPFALNLFGTDLQHTDQANLLFALSFDTNNLACLKRMFSIGQASSWGSETGGHQGGTREYKADGAAVNLNCREGGRIGVDEAKMGDWGSIDGLEEERGRFYCVKGHAVGSVV